MSRKLTPVDRITIIKTQIIQKLNHLMLAFPSPKTEYFLKWYFFYFLWCYNVHQITKSTIIKDFINVGLQIVGYGNLLEHSELLG